MASASGKNEKVLNPHLPNSLCLLFSSPLLHPRTIARTTFIPVNMPTRIFRLYLLIDKRVLSIPTIWAVSPYVCLFQAVDIIAYRWFDMHINW